MAEKPNEREAVQNLQRYLRQLSYTYPESIPARPPIDGVFEEDTRQAVREFQSMMGLPVTGIANQETWDAIYREYLVVLPSSMPPRQLSIFPYYPDGYELSVGSSGFPVASVQFMLRELEAQYTGLKILTDITGQFDKQTENAVITFQERNFLPMDGKVGKRTWNSSATQYNDLFARYPIE